MSISTNHTWNITANGTTQAMPLADSPAQFVATGTFDGASLQLQTKLGNQEWLDLGSPLTAAGKLETAILYSTGEQFRIVTTGAGGSVDILATIDGVTS